MERWFDVRSRQKMAGTRLNSFGRRTEDIMATTDDNKRLVKRYYEEVVNAGDVDRIPEFIAPDYVEVHDNEKHPIGRDGARTHIVGVREVYSDLRLTVERQIAEDDWVVSQVVRRRTTRLVSRDVGSTPASSGTQTFHGMTSSSSVHA